VEGYSKKTVKIGIVYLKGWNMKVNAMCEEIKL
jgi:hypothetical protein